VFEWFGDYAYLQSRQWSLDAAVNFMLRNHVTLINDNIGRVPPEAMPQLRKLARLAGARFVLRELIHAPTVARGQALTLRMRWSNVGVGRLPLPYALRLLLLDPAGRPTLTCDAQADPRAWLPGEHEISEPIPVPASHDTGDYTLALELVDPRAQRPPFRLAIDAPENAGRYGVSRVTVR